MLLESNNKIDDDENGISELQQRMMRDSPKKQRQNTVVLL
jgi:hypothetical protein